MPLDYTGHRFGRFSADLQGNNLTITMKIFWEWKGGIQNVVGGGVNTIPWKEQDKLEFKRSALETIPETWSGKWKFQHIGTGQLITPVLRVEDADAKDSASIIFSVENGGGVAGLIPNENKVNLFFGDDKDNASQRYMVQQFEYGRIERLFETNGATRENRFAPLELTIPVTGPGNWSIDHTSQAYQNIDTFARRLFALPRNTYKPQIMIAAASGNSSKARSMMQPVIQFLQQRLGNTWQIVPTVNKTKSKWHVPFKHTHSLTGSVTVSLSDIPTANNQFGRDVFHRYRVVDHEFGHCLGLPDEYMTAYPGNIGTAAHQHWYELCDDAMVLKNIASDTAKTRSIMSAGWEVHKCHYVTIWDALRTITGYDLWRTV